MSATNMGEGKTVLEDLEKQNVLETNPGNDGKSRAGKKKETGTGKGKAPARDTSAAVVLGLVVYFGLFALIKWLSLRPVHRPRYFMDNVQIKSLAANATSFTVDADFLYNVTAVNSNRKMDFKYDWITIDASYGGWNFGRGIIGGFKVGKTSSFTAASAISVGNVSLPPAVAASLAAAIANGSVSLRACAKAKLHVQIGKYVSFPLSLDLDCSLVVSPPPSPGAPGKVVSQECILRRPPYKNARRLKTYKAQ